MLFFFCPFLTVFVHVFVFMSIAVVPVWTVCRCKNVMPFLYCHGGGVFAGSSMPLRTPVEQHGAPPSWLPVQTSLSVNKTVFSLLDPLSTLYQWGLYNARPLSQSALIVCAILSYSFL